MFRLAPFSEESARVRSEQVRQRVTEHRRLQETHHGCTRNPLLPAARLLRDASRQADANHMRHSQLSVDCAQATQKRSKQPAGVRDMHVMQERAHWIHDVLIRRHAVASDMTTATSVRESIRGAIGTAHVGRLTSALRLSWTTRTNRTWLALVAVPLAMNASALTEHWWLWIPLVISAAAWTPAWRWTWVLSLQLAVVGTEWAYVGAVSLAMWPAHRAFVGFVWTGSAIALAVVGLFNRRYQSLPERHLRL
jgi:hypothetical protein